MISMVPRPPSCQPVAKQRHGPSKKGRQVPDLAEILPVISDLTVDILSDYIHIYTHTITYTYHTYVKHIYIYDICVCV